MLAAVGDELVIAHPGHHAGVFESFAIVGGPAVYVLGHLLFRFRMVKRTSKPWTVVLVILVAMTIAGALIGLPLVVLAIATTLVLVGLLIHDARRRRLAEQQPAS